MKNKKVKKNQKKCKHSYKASLLRMNNLLLHRCSKCGACIWR